MILVNMWYIKNKWIKINEFHYSKTLIAEWENYILSSLNLASKSVSFKYFYSKVG